MFGLTTRLHPGARERTRLGLIGLLVAMIAGLCVWMPSAAHAVTCENSWTNTAGGSWSEASGWSKKAVPASGEEVCITEPGTYTVTLTTSTTTTVKSLTIGGSSGAQTLAVGNLSNNTSALDVTSAVGVNAHGAITLTDGASQNGQSVTLESAGTITNAGTITAELAAGGTRFLKGNLVNTGTLQINTSASFNASKATLTNEGTLNLANEKTLTVAGESSVVNGKGGKIAATGNGDVSLEPKTSFTQGAGTTSGTLPVILNSASLDYTGSGSSTIAQRGEGGSLTGSSSSGQALLIENLSNVQASVTATSFANGGTITLTDAPSQNGQPVTLVSSGTLTNTGTITAENDAGGTRILQGAFVNKGTINIDAPTSFNGSKGSLVNEGTLSVGETFQLTVSSESSVTNTSGNIAGGSGEHPGDIFMEPKTSFTEGNGTTSGTLPVILNSAALKYTGTGASTIAQRNTEGTLSGSLASGQTLIIENVSNQNATVTASGSFTNAGKIILTDTPTQNGQNVTLALTAGTLTNTGTITTEEAAGGGRFLQGSITNSGGTIAINTNTSYNGAKALLTNEGTLNVATGKTLTVSNEGSVTNGTGGTIASGSSGQVFLEPGTSFTQGAGTTTGTLPVVIDSGSLDYTGSGSSTIAQRGTGGTLTGASSSGQALLIENVSNQNASVTATSFTNGGTITLTDAPSQNGQNVTLTSSGALTNTGTITAEADQGGTRILQGIFVNKGTIDIDAPSAFNGTDGALSNEGTLNVGETFQLTVSGESSVTNTSGNIAGGSGEHPGDVYMEPKTSFTEGNGTTSGTLPVIVYSGALHYTGSGSSTIAQRGTEGTLSGSLASGQTLSIQNVSNQTAVVKAAASFTNSGTIILTDAPGQNGQAITLALTAGTLTNTGTISTEEDAGGNRILQGNLTNSGGAITINTNTSYNATKALLTNEGTLNVANGKTLTVAGESSVTNGTGGTIAGGTSGQVFLEPHNSFTEGAGKTTGTLPVVIDNGALKYTGTGSSTIAQRGTEGTLSGNLSTGQTLSIQNVSNQTAVVKAAASFTNSGTIILTDAPGQNGQAVTLNVAAGAGTLTNKGTITTEADAGGGRTIEAASLKNEKTLSLGAGIALKVTGAYTQTGPGTFSVGVAGSSSFGTLSVTGTAKLAGALAVTDVAPFVGKAGESLAVLSSSSRTGTFSKETGAAITKVPGLYYKPTYAAKEVTLLVTQATLALSSTKGLPGTVVTISGSDYLPNDTITPSFLDHGVKTVFPTVTTNSSGEFSTEITIPASAAVGTGSISIKATHTGVTIKKTFKVT